MALKELWLARAKVGQNAHWFQPKSIFFQRYRSLLFAFDRLVRSGTAHHRRCVIVLAIREDLLRLKLCCNPPPNYYARPRVLGKF
jgi:hypothetical protein